MNTVKPIPRDDTTGAGPVIPAEEIAAARFYETVFVPALFQPVAAPLVAAAGVEAGHRVLDVACGTGVATREAARVSGDCTRVTGLDLAPGMVAVAEQQAPQIRWQVGDAGNLPYDDAAFDRVLCQFGLMFFPDRARALAEMLRVCTPGGRVAVAVWDTLDSNPGFAEKVEILEALAGTAAADALRAPFCLGDREVLLELARAVGLRDATLEVRRGEAVFNSIAEFVDAELEAWLPVMGVLLDDATKRAVHAECARVHERYREPESESIRLPVSAFFLCGGRA